MNKTKKNAKMEYRKKLNPIRADLKHDEREKLNKILEKKNQTIIGWIREKIEEDLKNI